MGKFKLEFIGERGERQRKTSCKKFSSGLLSRTFKNTFYKGFGSSKNLFSKRFLVGCRGEAPAALSPINPNLFLYLHPPRPFSQPQGLVRDGIGYEPPRHVSLLREDHGGGGQEG